MSEWGNWDKQIPGTCSPTHLILVVIISLTRDPVSKHKGSIHDNDAGGCPLTTRAVKTRLDKWIPHMNKNKQIKSPTCLKIGQLFSDLYSFVLV